MKNILAQYARKIVIGVGNFMSANRLIRHLDWTCSLVFNVEGKTGPCRQQERLIFKFLFINLTQKDFMKLN